MDFLAETKAETKKLKDFLAETRKLYDNLKSFGGLTNVEINLDEEHISYSLSKKADVKLYNTICHGIKTTVAHNHQDLGVRCDPPEGCLNYPDNRRKIIFEINDQIKDPEKRQEILGRVFTDINGILKELIKYGVKK